MSHTRTRTQRRSRWVWWLTVISVAAHFVFGMTNEITASGVFRVLSLAAAGLAVLAALLGIVLIYRSRREWLA